VDFNLASSYTSGVPEQVPPELIELLSKLSKSKLAYVASVVTGLLGDMGEKRNPDSDLVSDVFLEEFGVHLLAHHGTATRPLTKEQFERAMERVMKLAGRKAERSPMGNPGHDVTIDGVKFSLKTQADTNLKKDSIWISKFMELGKGDWSDKPEQLKGLRDQFLKHLTHYERIVSLRASCRVERGKTFWHYELVEIPKALLGEAANGKLEMKLDSTQNPKPGYCTVSDANGTVKFALYFDGGGERKLQVKDLKKSLCVVHAEWDFSPA
jgi:type II restriction enzyme